MRNIILIFGLLTVSLSAFSQNSKLDEKNGFKSVKIGDKLEDFEGVGIIKVSDGNIFAMWQPKDVEELKYVFDEPIHRYELVFDEESKELIRISVVVLINKKMSEEVVRRHKSLLNKLVAGLGNITGTTNKLTVYWKGTDIGLLYMIKPLPIEFDDDYNAVGKTELRLEYINHKVFKNKIDNGF